jgi:leucyl-tRNA synthetase
MCSQVCGAPKLDDLRYSAALGRLCVERGSQKGNNDLRARQRLCDSINKKMLLTAHLQSSTIQNEVFPQVADPEQSLIAASKYIRSVSAAVGAAEGAQQKRFARGKGVQYDPKQSKRLTIFVADSWPVWQLKCADIVRELFDGTNLSIEEASKRVDKSDMKKSMAFIHKIKKQLDSGVPIDAVFKRDLDFNETHILQEMIPGLKSTVPKLAEVHIIVVGGNSGQFDQLPQTAAAAEPGSPSFEFKNI